MSFEFLRSKRLRQYLFSFACLQLLLITPRAVLGQTTELSSGWRLQDSRLLAGAAGDRISSGTYDASGWYGVPTMPCTVLGALSRDGVYPNIYFGQNLASVPKLNDRSWWFRERFAAPSRTTGGETPRYWLLLKGISTSANVWVNGVEIADDQLVRGLDNAFEIDVTREIVPGSQNTLALEVSEDKTTFQSLAWIDWNPNPADGNLGIWQKVFLKTTGDVEVRHPYVVTHLPLPNTQYADLTVSADVVNGARVAKRGHLEGDVAGLPFSQLVSLQPGEEKTVTLSPIRLQHPRLWWPSGMGDPNLYDLHLRFTEDGVTSDSASIKFGVRQYEGYLSHPIYGFPCFALKINGEDVLLRGGAYRPDLLLSQDPARDDAEVRYWADMGWNSMRFEGTMGDERIYDLCDKYGIIMEPGWPCCSAWQDTQPWSAAKLKEGHDMMQATALSLRSHASSAVFFLGSDIKINTQALLMYHQVLQNAGWYDDKTSVDSAGFKSDREEQYGIFEPPYGSGIHMNGPYDVSTPMLWWDDTGEGAIGSCAEQSTGGCIPEFESVQRFIPAASIWPLDGGNPDVKFHTNFRPLNLMRDFINQRYGPASSAEQFFDVKAQLYNYEQVRAQMEAFGAKKFTEAYQTIYWMGNNSWPSFKWQLYDYYLKPTAGYFGFKKATRPLAIVYDLHTHNVILVNSTLRDYNGLQAEAEFYNIGSDGAVTLHGAPISASNLDLPENAHATALDLTPALSGLSKTYFIRLFLKDASGSPVADNLYWYSTQEDVDDFSRNSWWQRPFSQIADMTGLNDLRQNGDVSVAAIRRPGASGEASADITITNKSQANIAFFLRIVVTKGQNGSEALPALYSDNYISLWPGESKTITTDYAQSSMGEDTPWVHLMGENVAAASAPVTDASSQ